MSMKSLVVGVALIAAGAAAWWGVFGRSAQAKPAVFDARSVEEVVNAAGSKLVLVNLSASWCPPCQMMKRETWPDAEVEKWVKANALAVYVDVDERRDLGPKFGVRGIPAIIAMRRGVEVARTSGFMGPDELIAWMEEAKRAR
jgi:thiol-disulfide isomerase/thioredoxin